MTTTTRRTFLRNALVSLAAIPLLAQKCFAAKPEAAPMVVNLNDDAYSVKTFTAPSSRVDLEHGMHVQGLAIKVPSNRMLFEDRDEILRNGMSDRAYAPLYVGEWDGTFKLERGCSNPAYILADLYERSGERPDWVVAAKKWHRMPTEENPFGYGLPIDWQMLYHWGRWCDEMSTTHSEIIHANGSANHYAGLFTRPRLAINAFCQTRDEITSLREVLRMHCLSWQSTDPRYRTSWPGIPYPGDNA